MAAENNNQQPGRGDLAGLHVLVAEDQYLLADTIAVLLEEEGALVLGPFATTHTAFECLKSERVDFALVDMGLKDTFSDRLLFDLTARDIPHAVITGFDYLPTNAFDNAVEVLKKPVDKKKLVQLLKRFARGNSVR
jgi:DNA-binding NtrC family response regulator